MRHEDSLGKEPCGFLVTLEVRHVVGVCWKPLVEGSYSLGVACLMVGGVSCTGKSHAEAR